MEGPFTEGRVGPVGGSRWELGGADIIAHKLYGTLPWKDLVMPVAKLARQYQVSRELARRLRIFGYVSASLYFHTSRRSRFPLYFALGGHDLAAPHRH